MKKKIALLLSLVLTFAILLSACGTDPKKEDYNGKSYDDLKNEMQQSLQFIVGTGADIELIKQSLLQQAIQQYGSEEEFDNFLKESGSTREEYVQQQIEAMMKADELVSKYNFPQIYAEKLEELYGAGGEDYGVCTNFKIDGSGSATDPDKLGFRIDSAGKTLTTTVTLTYEKDKKKTDYTYEIVYSAYNMEMTGININEIQSLGKKMANAGLNTLISMAVVFTVLILISLIIYCFNIFPYLEKRKKEKLKERTAEASLDPVVTQIEKREQIVEQMPEASNDTELIAVIAAAVAAHTGTSTNDFVVRSIVRR